MFRLKTIWNFARPGVTEGYKYCSRSCSSKAGSKSERNYATQAAAEPFLSGSSSIYVEEMYSAWQKDPSSVHKVRHVNADNWVLFVNVNCKLYFKRLAQSQQMPYFELNVYKL